MIKAMLISTLILLTLQGCGSRKAVQRPNLSHVADTTYDCRFMIQVCNAAEEFQKEYHSLPDEQKKELTQVLNSYIEHCSKAVRECKRSLP